MSGVATPPAGLVPDQAMLQRPMRRMHLRRARLVESLAIFAVFAAAFGVLGCWLVLDRHIVTFDSLNRLADAYLVWHNDPPKLAAIGFALPPLQTIVLLPFTVIPSMATSLVALPICSALFGGLTMMVVNRLLERCDFATPLRYAVLLGLAATPTLCFYASAGGAEPISLFLLASAMSSLIAWFLTVDTRYLIGSAAAFSVAVMADYSTFAWLALAATMVAVTLSRHRASASEVEGSLITYVAPTIYAFALWCMCNLMIVNSPFGWIGAATSTSVNAAGSAAPPVSVLHAIVGTLSLAWSSAPLLLVVTPVLIAVAVMQRNELAAWLAAFSVLALFGPGAGAMADGSAASLALSSGAPMALIAVYGAACLYKSLTAARPLIGVALVVGLLCSIGIVWHGLATYPHQDLEQAFSQALSGEHPAISRGGLTVGIGQEQAMADYIDDHVHAKKTILTDNSQTYAVILLSGRPALFRTRLDQGDGPWLRDVRAPTRQIKYLLIAQHDSGDVIHETYLGAAEGRRRGLTVAFADGRYALLAVTPGTTAANSVTARSVTGTNGLVSVDSLGTS